VGEISEALRRAKKRDSSTAAIADESAEQRPAEDARPRSEALRHAPADDCDVEKLPAPMEEPLPELGPRRPERNERGIRVAIRADKTGEWFSRAVAVEGHGSVAESFRHLALRLRRELEARGAHTLAVVSALRSEGKTTIACNLSLAFASLAQGREVALVDLDLRRPSVAKAIGLASSVGIERALRGERSLREICLSIESPALDVYPVGKPESDAHEVLVRPELGVVLGELTRRYEIVVIDTPPVLLVPDATVIAEKIDAVVAVARAGQTTRRSFEHMIRTLPPGRVLGSLLNEGLLPARPSQYGYYDESADEGERVDIRAASGEPAD